MHRLVLDLNDARPVWRLPDWLPEEIRAALPDDWELSVVESPIDASGDGGEPSEEALRAISGTEVYLGYGIPEPLFRAAGRGDDFNLRWVHSAAAGVGASLHPEMLHSDVVLTNSAGIHAEPIAESAMAMLLFFTRGLDFAVRAQAERRWDKEPFTSADSPVREVAGSTLGVLGFGGIGRATAKRALALGMRVLALKRTPEPAPEGVELLVGDDQLAELLRRSDALVVALPGTPATHGLLGAEQLDLLPRHAVLVNVGRGTVLDESALAVALAAGRLRGAALDVFAREPLDPESPLWALPNVLVTPHVSGITRSFWRREADLILHNLRSYLAGEPMRNVVDKRAGY